MDCALTAEGSADEKKYNHEKLKRSIAVVAVDKEISWRLSLKQELRLLPLIKRFHDDCH